MTDIIRDTGFQFFGKFSASISHEINNALAIINEQAGLLEDIVFMTQKGIPINLEKIQNISSGISKQIRRANEIVKNLNKLSHSSDEPAKTVNLGESLSLVAAISTRLLNNHGVALNLSIPEKPVTIKTNPFLLKNIIWLCLSFSVDKVKESKTVELALEKAAENVPHIIFRGLQLPKEKCIGFPGENEQALCAEIRAELNINHDSGEITIIMKGVI